jgi:hypothetical protein
VPLLLLGAAAWAVVGHAGVVLSGAPVALAHVRVQTFGGRVESTRATTPRGRAVPLEIRDGDLTPSVRLTPGERIGVDVTVRRPGALAWLLGKTAHEHMTVTTPVVHPASRWLSVRRGTPVTVAFDGAVAGVSSGGSKRTRTPAGRRVSLGAQSAAGSTTVAVAARPWERLQPATRISWFPPTARPAVVSSPAADGALSPLGVLRLTFAEPVRKAIGDGLPTLTPKSHGTFSRPDAHTLVFTPSGDGFGVGTGAVRLTLPKAVALVSTSGAATRTTRQISWTIPPPSTLRLQQLLAEGGYLPLDWTAAGDDVARTRAAQADASVDAPAGSFTWRYAHTPPELRKLWDAGHPNDILRGAVMKFQDTHHLTVDGFAGADVWRELVTDTIAGRRRTDGYSYVFVHRDTPQLLTLWHDGHTVLTSPGNTGVPAAPTQLGTFPVFEHLASTTMSGTNPDGSHYNDPGVKWVSYFNGGDALHAFNRASFGTPQSLGCVELPEAAAKKVWPYTPIGTLVTIEP